MSIVDLPSEPEATMEPSAKPRSSLSWDPSLGLVPIGFGWDAEPLVLDWHGEGQPDLLVTSGGGQQGRRARVYRPVTQDEGMQPSYDEGIPVPALDGLRCLCPLPNGRVSRFDLVGLDASGLVFLRNTGDARKPQFADRESLGLGPDLSIGPCRIVQMFAVDWDGDRSVDLLVGVDDMTDYWPDPPSVPAEHQKGFNQKGGHPSYDTNGLWRGKAPQGRIFWLRNKGTVGEPCFELQPEIVGDTHPLDLGMHPNPLALAWDRPGSLELLISDHRGLVHLHRNFGDQRPPVLMEPRTLKCGGAAFQLPSDRTVLLAADLDGDRRDELIFGTADGLIFAVHSASGRQDVKNPRPLRHASQRLWLGGHAVVTAGDLHGQGRLDLVAGDSAGRLRLYRDLGESERHSYAAGVQVEAGGVPFHLDPGPDGVLEGPVLPRLGFSCPLLVDWTGNGRLDLIVSGAGGEVLFLRNDGSNTDPRFGVPTSLRCEGQVLIIPPRVRPAAADLSGEGRLDLIAPDLQGFLCVFPRIGASEVGRPQPFVDRLGRYIRIDGGFGLAGRCSLWAGRFRGPESVDLLIGISRANRHVVPAVTGRSYESLDEISTVLLFSGLERGVVTPRALTRCDGSPLVFGYEGCSPSVVYETPEAEPSLLVGCDDGSVTLLRREELAW